MLAAVQPALSAPAAALSRPQPDAAPERTGFDDALDEARRGGDEEVEAVRRPGRRGQAAEAEGRAARAGASDDAPADAEAARPDAKARIDGRRVEGERAVAKEDSDVGPQAEAKRAPKAAPKSAAAVPAAATEAAAVVGEAAARALAAARGTVALTAWPGTTAPSAMAAVATGAVAIVTSSATGLDVRPSQGNEARPRGAQARLEARAETAAESRKDAGARLDSQPAASVDARPPLERAPVAAKDSAAPIIRVEAALATPQPQPQPQPAADSASASLAQGPVARGPDAAPAPPTAFAPLVAIRVVPKAEGGTKAIEIRLDPPELGGVDVRLETARDGRVKAVLSVERIEAFELLKRESGQLEQALRDAGVDLQDEGLSFSFSDGGSQARTRGGEAASAAGRAARAAEEAEREAQTRLAGWRDGALDLRI